MSTTFREKKLTNDWDIKIPPIVLHFAPIVLALFCLTVSLSDYSLFIGFDEKNVGTSLSLILMFACFMLTFTAIRNPLIERPKSRFAILLSCIIAIAMIDEKLKFHEAFGKYIRRSLSFISKRITYYTDDVVIIIVTILGCILLYYCIKYFSDKPDLHNYLKCIVFFAIGHGVLDLISHKRYLWNIFGLDLTTKAFNSMYGEWLGCFEEWFKLWSEWFIILFLFRFFYKQKGPLLWSIQIFIGNVLAVFGLWSVTNANKGIPYFIAGEQLKFIRNYHLLLSLVIIWIAWSMITWILFKQNKFKRNISGLFFLCPFYFILDKIIDKNFFDSILGLLSGPILKNFFWAANMINLFVFLALFILPGIALGLFGKYLLKWGFYHILLILIILISIFGFSFKGIPLQTLNLLKIGGIIFPIAVIFIIKEFNRESILIVIMTLWALLLKNPIGILLCLAFGLIKYIQLITPEIIHKSPRLWISIIGLHILSVLLIIFLSFPTFMPNIKFRPKEKILFQTGYQPIFHNKKLK